VAVPWVVVLTRACGWQPTAMISHPVGRVCAWDSILTMWAKAVSWSPGRVAGIDGVSPCAERGNENGIHGLADDSASSG